MLREFIYPSDDVTQARPAIQNLKRSTKWLRETLKIAPRSLPKLEGDIRVQFGKFVERVFPVDNELPAELARGKPQLRDYTFTTHEHGSVRPFDKTGIIMEHTCSSPSPHKPGM
jgi:hypothetical protein